MEFASGKILGDVDEHVAIVTFNSPETRNAMSSDMWQGLIDLFGLLAANDAIRVVVMRGAGTKAFVAGGDLREGNDRPAGGAAPRGYGSLIATARDRIGAFPKPVIASINGFCIGAGVAIALEADLRVAVETASFAIPIAKIGLSYQLDASRRLISVIGAARARMLLYTGKRISAAEAERIGLVHQVVTADELPAATMALAHAIAENAPLSLAAVKLSMRYLVDGTESKETVDAAIGACSASADRREGRLAFLEKRKPVFRGV